MQTHSLMGGRFLRTEQVAEYFGIAVSTLEKLRVSGNGPRFIKFGRRVLYAVADLDAYVEARQRSSTSDMGASEIRRAA